MLDPETLDRMRYVITDLLTDLRDERPAAETTAIGVALYPALAEFLLRAGGRWSGSGKWLPRQLKDFDAAIAAAFAAAFDALLRECEPEPVLRLAETVLAPHGGPLFDGYRNDAPPAWRMD